MERAALTRYRQRLESAHQVFTQGQRSLALPQRVYDSWQRSSASVSTHINAAPLLDQLYTRTVWQESVIARHGQGILNQLSSIALENRLIVALSDAQGHILWTDSGRAMRDRAEKINFSAGGLWHERAVGTNALSEVLTHHRPQAVFAGEHYADIVHDWSCAAAPIIDPRNQHVVGVLDFSTTWRQHSGLTLAAVQNFAQSLSQLIGTFAQPQLILNVCQPHAAAYWDHKPLACSPRQMEILTLLALHPQGLSLSELHSKLYGDHRVSTTTLKSEISHIRSLLGSTLHNKPYRLGSPVGTDHSSLIQSIESGDSTAVLRDYRGVFLPNTDSPELLNWQNFIEAGIERAIHSCQDNSILSQFFQRHHHRSAAERLLLLSPMHSNQHELIRLWLRNHQH